MTRQLQPIAVFLLIAFGGAWTVWGLAWLLGVLNPRPAGQVAVVIGSFCVAAAAFVVRRWITHEGFGDAGLGLHLRQKWPWYVVAWLLPVPVLGGIVALAAALGLPFVRTELPPSMVVSALVSAVVLAPLFFGEEFGWRGYLQIRWCADRPLLAAVLTGLVWGVWHYPVILAGFEGAEYAWVGLAIFPVFTVLYSVVQGWLRQQSHSLWPNCLAHSAANFLGGNLSALLFYGGGYFALTSYVGVLVWVPLGAVCAWIVLTGRLGRPADAPDRAAPKVLHLAES